ncbi:elongation factor P maturation arginine rhamnosyltransferase EarP [Denitromonas iodatirespirans]|uniref:Protein-arginine rhamnosyltransferase n=1 Tax=Denitromonas iodatirespirans TaxID=2795389 RepID=A0A944DC08_DENI1|nr:elongation factor P maturation arginine rhamnosyltransferase EarP [Denitromonas iodatirespirans]MBT0959943.1 elongation factor P maturation arginine rhamnosyltransferase EarP [Denitromonas iodatirespirans]
MTWDIFCRVVDNFGDIGVSWRLARSLAVDHRQQVRLFVDDWDALRRLLPMAPTAAVPWSASGVTVLPWSQAECAPQVAEVVIEAFGCHLPPAYLAAMRSAAPPPRWINLEYLSAEDWIEDCHGLPSPDPATGLAKFFFFPGFTARTGGLIREPQVLARRDAAQAPHGRTAWLADHPMPDDVLAARWISLFAYDNPALPRRLADWSEGASPVALWVPEGRALRSVSAWLGGAPLAVGQSRRAGALTVCALPFLSMDEYDRLLAVCEVNFVRGEDSFVRAQWAARPFVWQAYPQAEGAHLVKLEAFLARYCKGLDSEAAGALRRLWADWNGAATHAVPWADFHAALPALERHARRWCDRLSATDGLVERLVKSSEHEVK